jgi:alpha-tubulin suppressor-like RCC1 family protein
MLRIITIIYLWLVAGSPANADLSFVFNSPADVAVTATGYSASGSLNLTLNFPPVPGQNLTVVKNTGTTFIIGTYDGIPQGASVPLTFNGVTYNYIADYYGGNGRSLVLQWPNLQIVGWGGDNALQGSATTGYGASPSLLANEGVLAGKTAVATAIGSEHALVLSADGEIFAWGRNNYGQLGDGTQSASYITAPVQVDANGALTGKTVVAIAAGSSHSLALTADGMVFAWGDNGSGRLGDATTQMRLTPVAVNTSGALAGKTVVAISAGQYHSLALTTDGQVFAWGYGFQGQLGNGSIDNQLSPVAVDATGVLAGKTVTGISAGFYHSVAVTSDGKVAAWGFNTTGQLGNNSTSPSPVPVQVVATGSLAGKTVTAVRAGANFNLALTSNGQVHAWGSNGSGQLGIGSTTNSLVPALAGGSLAGKTVTSIAAGNAHSTALTVDGQPHVWGSDGNGELGNGVGPDVSALSPIQVPGLGPAAGRTVAAVFAGGGRSHALTDPGPPRMRVNPLDLTANDAAPARFTAAVTHPFPTAVRWQMSASGTGGPFQDITEEPSASTGTLILGALGGIANGSAFRAVFSSVSGSATSNPATLHKTVWPATFSASAGPLSTVTAAAVAGNLEPALDFEPVPGTDLTLIRNTGPAPISGRFANIPQGATVPLTYNGVTYLYIANYHGGNGRSLVLQWPAKKVFGWGRSDSGLFGGVTSQALPVEIPTGGVMAGKTITAISHSGGHVLALTSDGKVFAWGENGNGQLGNGTTSDSNQPVAVDGGALAGKTVVAISAGSLHSLALTSEGRIIVWGQLRTGHGVNPNSLLPVELSPGGPLANETVVAISAGGTFDLALTSVGEIFGWGNNNSSQLGSYNTQYQPNPVLIGKGEMGTRIVTAVAAGSDHALALTEDGRVYAWGSNQYGALGIGNETPGFQSPIPVAVVSGGALAGRNVTGIAAVSSRSMVLTDDGRVFGWGINWNGELGTGNTASGFAPLAVESGGALAGKFATSLASGSAHSGVLTRDGAIYAWGDNGNGELGYPGWEDSLVPVAVSTEILAGAMPTALGAGWDTNMLLAGHGAPQITRHPLDLMAAAGETATFTAAAADPFPFTVKWQVSPTGPAGPFSDTPGDASTLTLPGITAAQDGWAYRAVFISDAGQRATEPAVLRVVAWSATLSSASPAPFAAERVIASGSLDLDLGFAPATGTNLTVIGNTGPAFISGFFANIPQGGIVTLTHNGVNYPFIANYHGSNGRSLVLQWPWTSVAGWGSSYGTSPITVTTRPALAAKTLTALKSGSGHQLALSADGKAFGWGSNNVGQLGNTLTTSSQTPGPVKDDGVLAGKTLAAIAIGTSHNLALSTAGELFSWGYNFYGQLGDGTKVNRTQPVAVIADGVLAGRTITAIAAGEDHSLALSSEGKVFAWGSNSSDQLGTENWQDSQVPAAVDIRGVLFGKTVVAIAAGASHSLALTRDGEVIAWGGNGNGQLGNGGTTDSRIPVKIDTTGALAGKRVVAIAAGDDHSIALASDGMVFTWGHNGYGQLGNNTTPAGSAVPVAVATDGVLAGKSVRAISAGGNHCLAVTTDGAIVSWGFNPSGQLGNASSVNSPVPVAVAAGGVLAAATVNATAAAGSRSFALLGVAGAPFVTDVPRNRSYLLGAGAPTVSATFNTAALDPLPFSIQWQEAGPTGNFSDIPGANAATLQIDGLTTAADGRRYRATFSNPGGAASSPHATLRVASAATPVVLQNADGIPFTAESPALAGSLNVALGFAPVPGDDLTLVHNSGSAFLTGNFTNLVQGGQVQLSHGGFTHSFEVDYFGGNGRSLVLHWADTLAVGWGSGSSGQLGNGGNLSTNRSPVAVTDSGVIAGESLVKLAAGTSHSLALAASGRIFAWGDNTSGRLGNGSTTASNVPVEVNANGLLAGKTVAAISAGGSHSLTLTSDGKVAAWGSNSSGQLGSGGSSSGSATPVAVSISGALAGKTVTAIAAGQAHSVALLSDGTLTAWGLNSSGQLGTGTTTTATLPVEVLANGALASKTVVGIAAGSGHTLALTADGRVYSWGSNQYGQLGIGSSFPSSSNSPVAVLGSGLIEGKAVVAISAGTSHSMAVTSDGKVYVWGAGSSGQLGTGATSNSYAPVAVSTAGVLAGKSIVAIAAGGGHSLALDSNGLGYAWGSNSSGQLGHNSAVIGSFSPVSLSMLGAVGSRPLTVIAAGGSHSLAIAARGTAPTISQSPASLTVIAGSTVAFTAAADGYPAPTVRWQRSKTGTGGSYADLAGETSGTLQLTNVTADQAGYAYRAVFTNLEAASNSTAAVLTVQPTMSSFLTSRGLPTNSPPLEDSLQTGVPNLLAYALDLNPAAPDRAKMPTSSHVGGRLRISYTRWKHAADLRYTVEASSSVDQWQSGYGITETVSITPLDNARETVIEQEILPDPSRSRFLRVRVELAPP